MSDRLLFFMGGASKIFALIALGTPIFASVEIRGVSPAVLNEKRPCYVFSGLKGAIPTWA